MKNNSLRHAYYTLGLLISIVIIGAVGYRLLGYTPSEAIYQTIITIATVGFEEVHPLDNTDVKLKRADMSYLINPVPETTLQETDRLPHKDH
jgi:hypothetical protein